MATLQEMIDKGKLACQPTGGGRAMVLIAQYDSSMGGRIDDQVLHVSIPDLEQQLKKDDLAVENAQAQRAATSDLLEFVRPLIEAEDARRLKEFEEMAAKEAAAKAEAEKPVRRTHKDKGTLPEGL